MNCMKRVVAMACMLSLTMVLTAPAAADAVESTAAEAVCMVESMGSGTTHASVTAYPCWLWVTMIGAACAGCVFTIVNPIPGDELVGCQACVAAWLGAEKDGCLD